MCSNNENKVETTTEEQFTGKKFDPNVCGYCGSTSAPIPYEEMYGPGAHGHDCCPDCGGV